MNDGGSRRAAWILSAIIAVAAAVRLWGITFGLPHVRVRPDELMILGVAIKMHEGQPNPGLFDYPGLYMYLVAGLYSLYYGLGLMEGWFSTPASFVANFYEAWQPYFLIPRVGGALMGTATVAVVYGITSRLLSRTAGLLAALFLALAFLHVRDSHYATTDVPMTFFLMCSVLAAARVHTHRRAGDAWLAGAFAGCATATKYNAGLIVLALAAVEALHLWEHRSDVKHALRQTHIWRMAAACLIVFTVTNPYLFLDYQSALRDLEVLQASTTGGMTPPEMLGRGWTYHLPHSLRYGVGIPMLASGLAGLAWLALRRPALALILGIFPAAYYLVAGAGHNVFVRYMIPVVPFLCIFAAFAAERLAAVLARGRLSGRTAAIASVLGILIVTPSAASVVQFDYLLAQEDNRIVGARWMLENVPAGSVIYTAGNLYGHMQLETRGTPARYDYLDFDWRGERFLQRGQPVDGKPDWIVIQRSGIVYSHVSPWIERLIRQEYELMNVIRAADLSQKNFYDIQDGFYAPFGSFKGVKRFGPNYEIYRRKGAR